MAAGRAGIGATDDGRSVVEALGRRRGSYRAFECGRGGALVPIVSPADGDFWFIAAGDPLIGGVIDKKNGRTAPSGRKNA
jgi:hypothetical protein